MTGADSSVDSDPEMEQIPNEELAVERSSKQPLKTESAGPQQRKHPPNSAGPSATVNQSEPQKNYFHMLNYPPVEEVQRRPFMERFTEYNVKLFHADKFVKVICYGLGTISGAARFLDIGNEEIWKGIHTIGGEVSKTRMVYRTFELSGTVGALMQRKPAGANWKDPRIHKLEKANLWCNLLYVLTEHLAWANSRDPKFVPAPMGSAKWWAFNGLWWWGCCIFRMWADFYKMKELKISEMLLRKALKADPCNKAVFDALMNTLKLKRNVQFSIARYIFFMPNAYHWALEDGLYNRGFACLMGIAEALVGIVATFPEK
uniref:Uncharacterized protein n=1 Tax=Heterosigma akashiwo TaxID=2829 RepID=A0A6S9I7G2_HETAK|mmetsp:Transcript_15074/g.24542  ORF Transcript_15074/g.24542 Transcript_15074/m.24542 type:complete len:317 (+) Transcript_15074:75-1025(+)